MKAAGGDLADSEKQKLNLHHEEWIHAREGLQEASDRFGARNCRFIR
jgi:hypothetical protein